MLVTRWSVIALVILMIPACRDVNPYYCPKGSEHCMPANQACGENECEAPTPVCKSEAEGLCVACTMNMHCPRITPICDTTVNECVGCTVNDDCESGLCTENRCADPGD